MSELVEVTQADIDAAKAICGIPADADRIRYDPVVQAFARHRLSSSIDVSKLPPHKASLSITHNQHKSYYETVAELIAQQEGYYSPDCFPEGERDKCIAQDEIWTLHWYPDTPVGFYMVHASTLEAAVNAALISVGERL